ncbi:MAG: CYTH domain-containing protein [Clostridium sp.]|nr:CYTH domain-containing protein [Prevotella sp.]MCM1428834.1 CYTH domain-containing protein [Clostridium sp.]MCM1475209.1 CYTH domain-containing protein [Muribaculaceae bacterium]
MALEIEHKYLVSGITYKEMSSAHYEIRQGYLNRDPERTVRVRTKGEKGFITIKGKNIGDVRLEFEYEIPLGDAKELLLLCKKPILEKIRWIVPYEGFLWEVDEFKGALEPLVTAEIELPSSDTQYPHPPFIVENVTGNPKYYNSNL